MKEEIKTKIYEMNRKYNELDNAREEAEAELRRLNYVFSQLMDRIIKDTEKIFS